jgi:hypothetical protein
LKKKLAGMLSVILAAVMVLGACSLVETEENATGSATPKVMVAEVGGDPIYYDDYYEQYVSMCEQWGVSPDDETYASFIQESVIETMVSEKVLTKMLTEKGYMDLTDTQLAKAEENAETDLNEYIDYAYKADIEADLGEGYTDAEYAAAADSYKQQLLSSIGQTWEQVVESYQLGIAEEAAKADLLIGLEPSEDDVRTEFDEQVAAEKEMMEEDPTSYEMYGAEVYYVPEGYRNVKHVLIKVDESAGEAVSLLRENELDAQADYLLEKALADIQEKAEEVLAKLQSDEITFDQAIADYNEDIDMPEEGYAVSEGSSTYMEAFTTGAMALESVGDISELIATDYGYHIISYVSDVTSGAVDYETVKAEIFETLKAQLQDEKWSALQEEWKTANNVVYYKENY